MNTEIVAKRLNSLKVRLLEDFERGHEAAQRVELEQNRVGRLSRIGALQQQEMQKASRALIHKRLADIDRALEALRQGEYGFCELCGEDIPDSRLEVRPEALICVQCQQKPQTKPYFIPPLSAYSLQIG